MNCKINKYGDEIYYIINRNDVENINHDDNKIIIIKSRFGIDVNGYKYVTKYNGSFIYANRKAFDNCPEIINNEIKGSIIMTIIKYDGNEFIVLLKNNNGKYTNPAGIMKKNESFEECAKRELFEETRLECKSFVKIGEMEHQTIAYDEK